MKGENILMETGWRSASRHATLAEKYHKNVSKSDVKYQVIGHSVARNKGIALKFDMLAGGFSLYSVFSLL